MLRSIVLFALYLPLSSGHIISKPSSHYSDAFKIKCDALPFRSVYFDRDCFFVVDADTNVSTSTKRCVGVLSDAKVAQPENVPDEVWSVLFVDKNSFISDAGSSGKTKAMCIFENQFPSSTGVITSNARGTTIHKGANLTARMMMPVLMKFPDALEVGQTTTIKGYFSPQENRPSFNLQHNDMETVAIHFVIDFNKNYSLIDTSRKRNEWDGSQKYGLKPNPFKRGGSFDIRFRIHEDHFQVFVNEQVYDNYKFRIPLATVNHLFVIGVGVVTYVKMGEKYNPVPYSTRLRGTTAIENSSARKMMPVLVKFPKSLEIGQTIIVKGVFNPRENRSSFNLQHHNMESVSIHFVIDFNRNYSLIDTSRKRNQWDGSQKSEFKSHPFKRGGTFDIRFRVQEDHFQASLVYSLNVFLNEKEHDNYKFRIPLKTVTHLGVNGIGVLTYVQLGEKYQPTLNSTTNSASLSDEDLRSLSCHNQLCAQPAEERFANGFPVCGKDSCSARREMYASHASVAECKTLYVSGIFLPFGGSKSEKFFVNLKRKNGDIALHFSPRFNTNNVFLNSALENKWQSELKVSKLPIKSGEKFEIAMSNDVYGFQIFVNGEYFTTFEHRLCPFDIAEVEVSSNIVDLGIQL